jgi:hypothetical protein
MTVTEGNALAKLLWRPFLRRAMERTLEIVGEAVGRLRRDDPDTAFHLSALVSYVVCELRSLSPTGESVGRRCMDAGPV